MFFLFPRFRIIQTNMPLLVVCTEDVEARGINYLWLPELDTFEEINEDIHL